MLCSSVLIGPNPYWIEFWTHLIVPGFNYVGVERDWSNLLSTHTKLEANPRTTAEIAKNAQKTMNYLAPVGVTCYLRELIRRYADVCRWTVEPIDFDFVGRRIPGIHWMPIEDYFLLTRPAGP